MQKDAEEQLKLLESAIMDCENDYNKAIKEDKKFSEVKIIFIKLKELKNSLMDLIQNL